MRWWAQPSAPTHSPSCRNCSFAMISMYKTTFEERTYFVYWLPLPKILGVCSGVDEVYELILSEKERAEFVKVSETILPTIWREAMGDKAFVISFIVSGSHCVISFGTKQTLTLRANHEANRIRFIMEEMLSCIELLTKDNQKNRMTNTAGLSTTVSLRRRKRPKKGIQWEEDWFMLNSSLCLSVISLADTFFLLLCAH